MNILKEIEDLEEKEELVDQLRCETLPLVMWGCGQIAEEVNDYLKMKGVVLNDIFVDDEYYTPNMTLDGKKIISYSELTMRYTKFNVILGNSSYEKAGILEQREHVNKIFYLFSVNYGMYDKTPKSLIRDHIDEFEMVYNLWEDEASRRSYIAFLKTRLSGNNQYILDVYRKGNDFFRNEIFQIGEEEVFLDIGAYDGDTLRLFRKENNGKYKKVYALEPDNSNRERLESYIRNEELQNIEITGKGAWNQKCKLNFSTNQQQISGILMDENSVAGSINIEAEPLDDMFSYSEKITLLKINYLDGVKEALEGASGILQNHQPKLVITVGFDCSNIRSIPVLIKKINSDYKLFLRFNRGMVSALTLYGVIG